MELIVDLILPPIFGFLVAKIVQRLPAKFQLFLGSIVIASIAAPLSWILFESVLKAIFHASVGQALIAIPILFILILFLTFFSINRFQKRQEKHLIQHQFQLASDLIREYRFQKALDILKRMNHPQAREWETILHDMIRNDPDFLQHLETI